MNVLADGGNGLKARAVRHSRRTGGSGRRPERLSGRMTRTVFWPVVMLAVPVILGAVLIGAGVMIIGR